MKIPAVLLFALLFLRGVSPAGDIVINEIHYEPHDETLLEEFIELYNAGGSSVDLSGWYFSSGIDYRIPDGTILDPDGYLLVAENPQALEAKFPGVRAVGPYRGYLSNDGETIALRNSLGLKEDEVDYKVAFPWPSAPAGGGNSLELIHPSLENELGGSWRGSGASSSSPTDPVYFIPARDPEWRYRKGTSEASNPRDAWRAVDFAEDETWSTGRTSIGYGDNDDNTPLGDMLNGYSSVYLRHLFEIPGAEEIPTILKLRLYVDDGCIVWINGFPAVRAHVADGEKAYNDVADNHEMVWEDFILENPGRYLVVGTNVLAIHAFNTRIDSSDFSIDAELLVPGRDEIPGAPTPGLRNSVYSLTAPPQIRQVEHYPESPRSGQSIAIAAEVTDPDGVARVSLKYQVVLPGSYIPARLALEPTDLMADPTREPPPNPAFEDPSNWTEVPLADDGLGADATAGDGIFTGAIPPQGNRTLVRYRIAASDTGSSSVTVPYPDDESLNFALFVYNGVPAYRASKASVHPDGPGHVYPVEVMTVLPVYFLITRNYDLIRCIAYSGSWQIPKGNEDARDAYNWEGAFVYEGRVYDHIRYRLRQANDRYHGGGKRSWRIRFNRGYPLRARDNYGREYPTRWRTLNIGKMFDNLSVGNFGLTETLNSILWNMVGVPAPFAHTFHFRVVDGVDEVPPGVDGQYSGDFWGMALAMEDYDPKFLDAHGLPDGNLYKLKDGIFDGNKLRRNQGRYSVTTDADFQNIRSNLRPERDDAWLDAHVNYSRWYPYHAVVEGIRHYDFVPADSHSKNRAWFFEPDFSGSPYGRLWTLPWDSDASWGPNWNSGIDYSMQAIYGGAGKPDFKREYRNVLREFRDLVWQEDIIDPLIDELAGIVGEFAMADRDRWRNAPAAEGSQDYGTMEWKVQDMKNFAFVGWSGGSGPTVPAGGRARYLETLADAEGDAAAIPRIPSIAAKGPKTYPIDKLLFETTAFSDPQGDGTFGAMMWRLAETPDPWARTSEWSAVWESRLDVFEPQVTIPLGAAQPGRGYRIRVRMMDGTGRWSHWSRPVGFVATDPEGAIPQREYLRVTEIMYNPTPSGDLEFVEIQNIGSVPVSLEGVRIAAGIEFDFSGSAVTSLGPGEFVVVVKSRALFDSYFDTTGMKIAGEFAGRLDNGGEAIVLVYGTNLIIQEFAFDDAWHPATDGDGYSLVIVDPRGFPELWSQKEGWRPSAAIGGSPGAEDVAEPPGGRQLPGDLNQDGALDISDAIGLLLALFSGSQPALPCGESLASPGNAKLLDGNGDGSLDLTDCTYVLEYLFLSGPPPALGESCVEIRGCPERCGG